MNQSIESTVWAAFDTETTGLSPVTDRVIEIGAVKFDSSGRILAEYQSLVDPGMLIPAQATAVHGLTCDDLRGARSMKDVLPEFFEFLGTGDTVLIAHNASFDAGFIGAEMEREGVEDRDFIILDTLSLSRQIVKSAASHSLGYLAGYLGVDAGGHHRALADSVMVKEIFLKLLGYVPSVDNLEELTALASVYRFTGLSRLSACTMNGFQHFQRAIEDELPILMVYRGGSKGSIPRKITPLGIVETRGHQYVRAYCHTDGVEKSFRMDKIESFTPVETRE